MSDAADSTDTPRRRSTDRIATRAVMVQAGQMDGDVVDAVPLRLTRHDPSFLTHLIAIAERCPQTRVLRRATPEDAMAAYRAVDAKGHTAPVGITTRQDV